MAKLLRRLYRNELRRAFTAISTGATNHAVTWSTGANANPDNDVLTDLITATTASGIRPNRLVYGDSAWQNRHIAYENVTNTATAFANVAAMSPEQLAARLMVDKIYIQPRARYQSSGTAKSEVLGSAVYAFFAEDGVDTEDPSNTKRFVTAFSGEQVRGEKGWCASYVQQISSKLVAITVEHYSKIVVTSTLGMRKWTIS